MGIIDGNGYKDDQSRLRRSLYLRWFNMMDRCYNTNHRRYADYGGIGVSVCGTWHVFEIFFRDVQHLPGFDINLILDGGIHLDKDSIVRGNKLYSKETCCFLTAAENNKYIPSRMLSFMGTAPDGQVYESFNQTEFAVIHNLRQSTIADCLSGRVVKHRGWTFKYKE